MIELAKRIPAISFFIFLQLFLFESVFASPPKLFKVINDDSENLIETRKKPSLEQQSKQLKELLALAGTKYQDTNFSIAPLKFGIQPTCLARTFPDPSIPTDILVEILAQADDQSPWEVINRLKLVDRSTYLRINNLAVKDALLTKYFSRGSNDDLFLLLHTALTQPFPSVLDLKNLQVKLLPAEDQILQIQVIIKLLLQRNPSFVHLQIEDDSLIDAACTSGDFHRIKTILSAIKQPKELIELFRPRTLLTCFRVKNRRAVEEFASFLQTSFSESELQEILAKIDLNNELKLNYSYQKVVPIELWRFMRKQPAWQSLLQPIVPTHPWLLTQLAEYFNDPDLKKYIESQIPRFSMNRNELNLFHRTAIEQNDPKLIQHSIYLEFPHGLPSSLPTNLPLFLDALKFQNQILIQYLIRNGINLNKIDPKTIVDHPMDLALDSSNPAIIKILVENNINWTLTKSFAERRDVPFKIVRYLMKHFKLDEKNSNGFSFLHLAADFGRLNLVKLALEQGADLESKNKGGFTPLAQAVYRGHLRVVEYLLEQGANVQVTGADGRSIRNLAENFPNPETRQKMLQLLFPTTKKRFRH